LADPIAPYDFEQQVKDEPKSSAPWLELIVQGERAFQNYNDRCDNVDRLFADMNYLANITRDRQYNLLVKHRDHQARHLCAASHPSRNHQVQGSSPDLSHLQRIPGAQC
jgi:hypothetical protein